VPLISAGKLLGPSICGLGARSSCSELKGSYTYPCEEFSDVGVGVHCFAPAMLACAKRRRRRNTYRRVAAIMRIAAPQPIPIPADAAELRLSELLSPPPSEVDVEEPFVGVVEAIESVEAETDVDSVED
jgi:hypothetical protein